MGAATCTHAFGMTTTKTLRSVFSWRTTCWSRHWACWLAVNNGGIPAPDRKSWTTPMNSWWWLTLFVSLFVLVCGTYIVYYINGTGLRLAKQTCIVHVLCTMMHKGDLQLGRPLMQRYMTYMTTICMTCIWCENSAPHNQLWGDCQNKQVFSVLYAPLCSSLTPPFL